LINMLSKFRSKAGNIYHRVGPSLGKVYRLAKSTTRRAFSKLISPIWPPAVSDYVSSWWRLASGRYGMEIRTQLERQLPLLSPPSRIEKPRVFFGLYHAPEQVIFNQAFKQLGLTSKYDTLDLNPGFPTMDVNHHQQWSPDIYREHAILDGDVLLRTNPLLTNDLNLGQLLEFFLQRWDKYDVFHFNWFMSFLPDNMDVEFLRRSGRLVYFQFHGCFIMYHNKVLVDFTERGESVVEMCQLCHKMGWRRDYFARWYRGITHANRVFVTNPCWSHCSPDFEYLPSPLEPSLAALPQIILTPKSSKDPIVILHAPSNPYIKGTPHVKRAVEELQKEGFNVELRVIQNLTRAEAMRQYGNGDIFIEQLHLGSYGNAAIEAMAHGIPVISSNHLSHAHLAPGCPIVHADPVTITDRLRELVCDYELRVELGRKCYTWVREFHSSSRISAHLLNIYLEDLGLRTPRARNVLANKEPVFDV
jgi:glycosyltransferase involved in cell wall biosynthesis